MVLDHGVKTSSLFRLVITIDDRFFDEPVKFGFAQSRLGRFESHSALRVFPCFHAGVPSCLRGRRRHRFLMFAKVRFVVARPSRPCVLAACLHGRDTVPYSAQPKILFDAEPGIFQNAHSETPCPMRAHAAHPPSSIPTELVQRLVAINRRPPLRWRLGSHGEMSNSERSLARIRVAMSKDSDASFWSAESPG